MGLLGGLIFAVFFACGGTAYQPKVPAVYVFGDSTVDVGNNNYMPGTNAKADYAHYGIDFPRKRQTGRFSNGYNVADFLAIHMGFKRSPPPYLSLAGKTNHRIFRGLQGVNFASGGSGILSITGTKGSSITMADQIQYFAQFRSDLATRMGTKPLKRLLSKSIFLISSGGNDIFGFFSQQTSPNTTQAEQFIKGTLLSNLRDHIKALYSLGARKFLLIDVAPLGCAPYARALNPSEGCIDGMNSLAVGFNGAVKALMSDLTSTLKGVKYSIGGSYALITTIMANPDYHAAVAGQWIQQLVPKVVCVARGDLKFKREKDGSDAIDISGHTEIKKACCGSGKLNAQVRCNQNTTYCAERGQYLFWDMLHPTHATAKKVGLAFYGGSLQFASPINGKQLVEAHS